MAYYMGDYYRGDPFLGGLIPVLGGLGAKLIPKVFGGLLRKAAPTLIGAGIGAGLQAPGLQIPLPGQRAIRPFKMFPGGEPGIVRTGCPPGFHLNKGGRFPQTKCVRNRRLNPANPRALRRAIRREKGFISLARHTLKGTGITIGRRSFAAKKGRR